MSDDFPDLKMKALVAFPATANGGTGIDVVKQNGSYQINLDFGELAQISAIPAQVLPTTFLALWESTQDTYRRMAIPDLQTQIGAVPAVNTPLVESGSGVVGVSLKYAREDHVHPLGPGSGGGVTSIGGQTGVITLNGGALGSTELAAPRYDVAQTLTTTQTAQARSNIAAPGLNVPNVFTDATSATSTSTGALKVAGGISTQDAIFAAKKIASNAPSTTGGQIDVSGSPTISVAMGANAVALPGIGGGVGYFALIDETNVLGYTGMFFCTNGNQPFLIYSNNAGFVSGVNVAGKASLGWDGANFSLYNNIAGPAIFHILAFRIS